MNTFKDFKQVSCNLTDEETFNFLSIDFESQLIVFKLICVKYFTLLYFQFVFLIIYILS